MSTRVDYPTVPGEHATLEKIHTSLSISRIGDGEAACMDGKAQVREPANAWLAEELRHLVYHPFPGLLVGIPALVPGSPKYNNWLARAPRILKFLNPDVQYVSAFISRPDSSAENLRTIPYCTRMVELWKDKRTALVSEPDVAIYRLVHATIGTGELIWVPCPHRETYGGIEDIEVSVVRAQPDVAILSCGPAATCLAWRLTQRGVHAIDAGSCGGFILKTLYRDDSPP